MCNLCLLQIQMPDETHGEKKRLAQGRNMVYHGARTPRRCRKEVRENAKLSYYLLCLGISHNYRCVSEAEGNTRPSNNVCFTIDFAYDCGVRGKFIITAEPLFLQKPRAFWPSTGVGGKVMENTCSKKVCVLSHRMAKLQV